MHDDGTASPHVSFTGAQNCVMLPCIITAVPLRGPSTAPAHRAPGGSSPAPAVPPAHEKPPVVGRQQDGEATAHLRTAVNLSIPPGLAFRVPRLLGSGWPHWCIWRLALSSSRCLVWLPCFILWVKGAPFDKMWHAKLSKQRSPLPSPQTESILRLNFVL